MNEIPEPGRATMLLRGCTRRCPRCGSGRLFHRWFVMVEECSGCGLHFEREPGYWVGAMAMNIIAVGGIFAVVFVTLLALTLPDIPVIPLLATLVPIAALGPIALYPFSKTLWVAVDRAFLHGPADHAPAEGRSHRASPGREAR